MAERRWPALAGLLSRTSDQAQVADCLQCGRDRVDIVGAARGRVRVSCRACGAVTLQDASRLRPPAKAAAAPEPEPEPTPEQHPLAPYVSTRLLAWAIETGRDRRAGSLDKGVIYRLWKEFDRSRSDAALPAFGAIVGLLHERGYDEALVVSDLADDERDPDRAAAIAERVGCARRWLAGPGRPHCWIERRADDAAIAGIDSGALRSLLADGAFDEVLTSAQREALYVAAFGATGGPPTRALLSCFDAESLAAALQTHLLDGSHPLRAHVLASLDGRDERDPLGAGTPAGAVAPC